MPRLHAEAGEILEELLARTRELTLMPEKSPAIAVYPASGFATLPLHVR